jgi:hypothetical protein
MGIGDIPSPALPMKGRVGEGESVILLDSQVPLISLRGCSQRLEPGFDLRPPALEERRQGQPFAQML